LPDSVVSADTVDVFKIRVDRFYRKLSNLGLLLEFASDVVINQVNVIMPLPLIGGGIKRWWCLTSIGPKSRSERPRIILQWTDAAACPFANGSNESRTVLRVWSAPNQLLTMSHHCCTGYTGCRLPDA